MLLVGLMSGTSLDGMDAALVRVRGATDIELLAHVHRPYAPAERARLDAVLAGGPVAEVARLHTALGDWAAQAVDALLEAAHVRADQLAAIAFPGQTIWHEPPVVTWQLGDPAILAERFGVRVVHDFRARDVAAGGEGAPLVPMVDALCFGAAGAPRILLNIGGMANATWVGERARLDDVVAGDSGPGMAVIDAIARLVDRALPYDAGGALAAQGTTDPATLELLLADPFFATPPPRSTGRERYGADYAARLHHRLPGPDGVRTAVALTVETIADFCERFLPPAPEVVVAGGGTHHPVLMHELTTRLAAGGRRLVRFDECFFPAVAKEAVAFAVLGWLTIHGQPGNLPRVTGARGPRVLGSVTPA
ncbi:MAG: anhydro-N-acetylmuramic acid kinase [Gemmatimonadetes bacterium]|nr:anhydro-N-acetylmuramic acid kinase [Gemmatimonadota bacterium]